MAIDSSSSMTHRCNLKATFLSLTNQFLNLLTNFFFLRLFFHKDLDLCLLKDFLFHLWNFWHAFLDTYHLLYNSCIVAFWQFLVIRVGKFLRGTHFWKYQIALFFFSERLLFNRLHIFKKDMFFQHFSLFCCLLNCFFLIFLQLLILFNNLESLLCHPKMIHRGH